MPGQVQLARALGLASLSLCACSLDSSGFGQSGDSSSSGGEPSASSSTGGSVGSTGPVGAAEQGSGADTTGGSTVGPDATSTSTSTSTTAEGSTGDDGTTEGPSSGLCDDAGPELQACYDFMGIGAGVLEDRSGNGNDGTVTDAGVVAGPFGEAAMFGGSTRIEVPDSESLDISGALTHETWSRVDAVPESGRIGLLDNDGQYSLFIYASDEYRCSAGNTSVFVGPVVLGDWVHVACVFDDDADRLRLYVNGVERGSESLEGDVNTSDADPMAIGDDSPSFMDTFTGAIGGARVWSTARTTEQLCAAAGELCER